MQWIAGQGDNGAYGMRLKNVSGSSSASAHHAWMMHSPLKGAKSLNRGMLFSFALSSKFFAYPRASSQLTLFYRCYFLMLFSWVTWENVTNAHAAFEVAHNPHHGMPLTKDLWYYAYTG
ncbi:hypothetical protein G5I_03323 [Acromyrmex echinatior]|uniref:Uncharacterized protein n=1 Tax=Acromyrmex echinatior TaxID=103372 RepID=F4WCP7_ACREC|nr:hypothetical protein G5I_03323 [Acromyrmex echinatior]